MRSRRLWITVAVLMIALAAGVMAQLSAQTKKALRSGAGQPSRRQVTGQPAQRDESLKDALVRKLKEALDSADDVTEEDRRSATKILRDADAQLTRFRKENRQALEQANRLPRIVRDHVPQRAKQPAGGEAGQSPSLSCPRPQSQPHPAPDAQGGPGDA